MSIRTLSVLDTGAVPDSDALQTAAFQAALDQIWQAGGGRVTVPAGRYRIGGIRLRSNTTLYLCAGAALYASRDPEDYGIALTDALEPLPEDWRTDKVWEPFPKVGARDYDFFRKPGGRWGNAIIRAIGAENIAILGEPGSVIDGCDCYDERGEERYRGPHGISMHFCRNVTCAGYTARNTGNWAHCIFFSDNLTFRDLTVTGGHDGIHFTRCRNITIADCAFYTGDDCVAGFGNVNTLVERCICNTACSAMRFGGTNALIRDCRFYGPAKYFFRGSLSLEEKKSGAEAHRPHRVNMLSVFTYFADFSVDIPDEPGNIIIRDCTVENVDRFLHYNYSGNERWQANRPLSSVRFEQIDAVGIGMPLTAYGASEAPLDLVMRHVRVAFRDGVGYTAFLHAANYSRILLEDVTVDKTPDAPLIKTWSDGGEIILRDVTYAADAQEWILRTDEPFVCRAI